MIKYEWRTDLSLHEADELADLLDRAARYDAEAEHNGIESRAVEQALAESADSVRHLIIWMLPHAVALDRPDEPTRIAALVRLEFTGATHADVTAVVDPELRSIGIITSLLEQAGATPDQADGWLGSGAHVLSAWARGNHPAAGRLSRRFLIPPSRRMWKLIRPVDSSDQTRASADAGTFTIDMKPAVSDEFGPYLTIDELSPSPSADSTTLRGLLHAAAAAVVAAGYGAVAIHVDAENRSLVSACRIAGFQHDRTDVCYQLGDCK